MVVESFAALLRPTNALPGTRLELARGRTAQECAVRIFVGKVEFSFLFPVSQVIASMKSLMREVEDDPDNRLH